MSGLPQPFQFRRLNPQSLDPTDTFETMSAFQAHLAGGTAYPGQVVSVANGTNKRDLYHINEDLTYTKVGEGSGDITNVGETGINNVLQTTGFPVT